MTKASDLGQEHTSAAGLNVLFLDLNPFWDVYYAVQSISL